MEGAGGKSALKSAVLMHLTLSIMLNRSGTAMRVCQNRRKGPRNHVAEHRVQGYNNRSNRGRGNEKET